MRATLLLADSAQVADSKLYILGGGWSIAGPGPFPMAVAVKVDVPWDETNRSHHLELQLLDQDGNPAVVPGPMGQMPLLFEGDFEVGRPPGTIPGVDLVVPLAFQVGPLQLSTGSRYTWRLRIDGEDDENWQASFSTRSGPTGPPDGPYGEAAPPEGA